MKTCTKCKINKSDDEFFKRSDSGKLRSHCKICYRQDGINWNKRNPEAYKLANRESTTAFRANNPKRAKEILRNSQYKHKDNCMLGGARNRAKCLSLPFNIELSDVVIPETCPILGIKLRQNTIGEFKPNDMPSLDRKIPSLGYVKGNVQVISWRANLLKSDMTVEELKAIIKYIEENSPV